MNEIPESMLKVSADDIIERGNDTFFVRMSIDINAWNMKKDDIFVISKGNKNNLKAGEFFLGIVAGEFKVMQRGKNGINYRFPNVIEKRETSSWGKIMYGIHKV
ncbi:hypothetical protein [Flammeovirga agarivorans]|uniref:Peptidase S24/S26A/S26B/S26C domain-containing protein n=1 Tax=Flammeovirga agarivorans TaxID=2726742 RepID=A0A7X8XZE3_9BACT|nr:hypothetical protein [Flammeovirga agarivorans]NLR94968.1 hypothetical protein [Flammeovirga agarivorans]